MRATLLLGLLSSTCFGCSGDDDGVSAAVGGAGASSGGEAGTAGVGGIGGLGGSDGDTADAGSELETFRLGGSYDLEPGDEQNLCARVNLEEDLWVTRLSPTRGDGTHHVIAALDASPGEPGVGPCDAFEIDWTTLFAASINSPALQMPEGVALHLPAGSQLMLQMHVLNTSVEPIRGGESAIELELADPATIEHEAEVVLVGPVEITIDTEGSTAGADCTATAATNFFAVFPHMHDLGRHSRVWVQRANAQEVVHDAPFDPEDQIFVEFDPIALGVGDQIGIECTYAAPPDGQAVGFGPFRDDEMCFAVSYRYPPVGAPLGSLCFE